MIENEEHQMPSCRICLEITQPIFKLPCKCKGTMSFIHETCLNDFMKDKEQKGDFEVQPNGIKKIKCDVCKGPLDLQVQKQLRWDKLPDIQLQLFLILFVILCLGLVGLQLAEQLVKDAFKQNNGYIQKFVYLFSYIWLIGIVLYLLIQPIISEIKQDKFVIKPKSNQIKAQNKLHQL